MAQFYKELKDLRISKEISLEDLETKTKINVKYLNAIEQGDFDVLPTPYLRLFIRAYAIEIGGDSERALEQLDSFVGNNRPIAAKSKIKNAEKEENKIDENLGFFNLLSESNLKLRNDKIIYWLATKNFFAVTKYNRSYKYAAAVLELAEALKNKSGS